MTTFSAPWHKAPVQQAPAAVPVQAKAAPKQKVQKPAGPGRLDRVWGGAKITGSGIYSLVRYLFSLKWVVDLVRWMINRGGYIAESAFILATVYVTVNTVAHTLVSWVMTDDQIKGANQLAVICFSVLPELIIFAALNVTFDHWRTAFLLRDKGLRNLDKWAWAIAYSIPTSVFLFMTIATISTFVSVESVNPNAVTIIATGNALVARCLSGWFYGVIQMLYETKGKRGHSSTIAELKTQIDLHKDTVTKRDATVKSLQEKQTALNEQVAQLQSEIESARLALAAKRMHRAKSESATAHRKSENVTVKSESATVKNANGDMTRHRIKKAIQSDITKGIKPNYKDIAKRVGLSYRTVLTYAPKIIEELQQENARAVEQNMTEQHTEELEEITV